MGNMQNLVQKLKKSNYLVTTIESCTGGLVANLITDASGSSKVFWGGRVVYDNEAKIALGVSPSILESYGAASQETAFALAENGLNELQKSSKAHSKHTICVATTGLAERDEENRNFGGVCWIGIASNCGPTFVERIDAPPQLSRKETKLLFARRALELLESFVIVNDLS
ncbi:17811_t:CDS:1 [Cetraspora pellucida]|uniref:17811_t:CDS:1 n=1 Tax=Cetraspora pellucida TaxID=1433469 RepID=A0ACA9NLB3_9GLOM|nr:17811_t:CDS:1 [Cetraspora pellucida]